MKIRGKKPLKWTTILMLLLIPGSVGAFLGIGDSGDVALAAILTELKSQSLTLTNLFQGMDFMDNQISQMRERVTDILPFDVPGLTDRLGKFDGIITDTSDLYKLPLLKGLNPDEVVKTVQNTWGGYRDDPIGELQKFRDALPTYTMGQSALIMNDAQTYADTGATILDDLHEATEGKASVRAAQAGAVQVKQLAQIESNQALQISLQSQQLLQANEFQKGIQQASGSYLSMLENNINGFVKELEARR